MVEQVAALKVDMLRVVRSAELDTRAVARLADAAYDGARSFLTDERIYWTYSRAFGDDSFCIQLFEGDSLVGHGAVIGQKLGGAGKPRRVAQLADLFVTPERRCFKTVLSMYRRFKSVFKDEPYDVALTMPNAKAIRLNERFLDFSSLQRLDFRGGVVCPKIRRSGAETYLAQNCEHGALADLLAPYLTENPVGEIIWSADRLATRLQPPTLKHGTGGHMVHVGPSVALVSGRNLFRGVPYVLVWAVLSAGDEIDPGEVSHLLRCAARDHGTPGFVYTGWNERLTKPLGQRLPDKLRPSPLTVQGRSYDDARQPVLRRYELIDFDFA